MRLFQVISVERNDEKKYLDNCLEKVKEIITQNENEYLSASDTYRIGNMVLIKISNSPKVYTLSEAGMKIDNDPKSSAEIMLAKMKYYTSYIYEEGFSLYRVSPSIENFYIEEGYLPMKIGSFDWKTYKKYEAKISF